MRAGCFIAPLTFQLYWHSFNIGSPTSEYKAPFANIYRGMAVIGTQVCCISVSGMASCPCDHSHLVRWNA